MEEKNTNSKKRLIKKIALIVIFNLLMVVSFFSLERETIILHEAAHKEIAENHGCVDYKMETDWKNGGSFQCLQYVDNINKDQEQMLHSINEIVGYNVYAVVSAIVLLCLIFINAIFFIWLIQFD